MLLMYNSDNYTHRKIVRYNFIPEGSCSYVCLPQKNIEKNTHRIFIPNMRYNS